MGTGHWGVRGRCEICDEYWRWSACHMMCLFLLSTYRCSWPEFFSCIQHTGQMARLAELHSLHYNMTSFYYSLFMSRRRPSSKFLHRATSLTSGPTCFFTLSKDFVPQEMSPAPQIFNISPPNQHHCIFCPLHH